MALKKPAAKTSQKNEQNRSRLRRFVWRWIWNKIDKFTRSKVVTINFWPWPIRVRLKNQILKKSIKIVPKSTFGGMNWKQAHVCWLVINLLNVWTVLVRGVHALREIIWNVDSMTCRLIGGFQMIWCAWCPFFVSPDSYRDFGLAKKEKLKQVSSS